MTLNFWFSLHPSEGKDYRGIRDQTQGFRNVIKWTTFLPSSVCVCACACTYTGIFVHPCAHEGQIWRPEVSSRYLVLLTFLKKKNYLVCLGVVACVEVCFLIPRSIQRQDLVLRLDTKQFYHCWASFSTVTQPSFLRWSYTDPEAHQLH